MRQCVHSRCPAYEEVMDPTPVYSELSRASAVTDVHSTQGTCNQGYARTHHTLPHKHRTLPHKHRALHHRASAVTDVHSTQGTCNQGYAE